MDTCAQLLSELLDPQVTLSEQATERQPSLIQFNLEAVDLICCSVQTLKLNLEKACAAVSNPG